MEGKISPINSQTYLYIENSPTYGRPRVEVVENISFNSSDNNLLESLPCFSQQERTCNITPLKYNNCQDLTSSNKQFDHSQDALKKLLKSWNLDHLTEFLICPETDAEECIRSLKYDNLSVTEFDSCWQACSQYRMQNVQQANSLDDIFAKWPEYKTPTGFRLIDKDFATIYGSRPGILARWPEQANSLMNFLLKQTQSRDKKMRAMLESINQEDVNSDATAVKLLWCLHFFLFPTQKSVKKDNCGKKSVVKFTVSSSQQAFLFMGKSIQEIDDHITFLKSKGESIQPFMLAVGDSDLENIVNFYVYIDGVKFLFNCFLRAVDICFKTFHLFNLKYPPACSQFWAFIENHFYDMKITKNISSKMFVLSEQLKSPSS